MTFETEQGGIATQATPINEGDSRVTQPEGNLPGTGSERVASLRQAESNSCKVYDLGESIHEWTKAHPQPLGTDLYSSVESKVPDSAMGQFEHENVNGRADEGAGATVVHVRNRG
jgi:hypothetical protein